MPAPEIVFMGSAGVPCLGYVLSILAVACSCYVAAQHLSLLIASVHSHGGFLMVLLLCCRRIQGRQEQLLDAGLPVRSIGKAAMLVVVFWSSVQVPEQR